MIAGAEQEDSLTKCVLDWHTPGLDGIETGRRLSSPGRHGPCPIGSSTGIRTGKRSFAWPMPPASIGCWSKPVCASRAVRYRHRPVWPANQFRSPSNHRRWPLSPLLTDSGSWLAEDNSPISKSRWNLPRAIGADVASPAMVPSRWDGGPRTHYDPDPDGHANAGDGWPGATRLLREREGIGQPHLDPGDDG